MLWFRFSNVANALQGRYGAERSPQNSETFTANTLDEYIKIVLSKGHTQLVTIRSF